MDTRDLEGVPCHSEHPENPCNIVNAYPLGAGAVTLLGGESNGGSELAK
jgi:hypothetical protein